MSRLAFHLPRLLALALAIVAATSAYWLQSLGPDTSATPPANAAVESSGTQPCGETTQGFTSYMPEHHVALPAGDCAKPRTASRPEPRRARRHPRHRHRPHPQVGS